MLQLGSQIRKYTITGQRVDGSAALLLYYPAYVTLDPACLHIGGCSTSSLHYGGETYASLSVDFVQFALGLSPVGVRTGRADMSTSDGTRVAYYDPDGLH